MVLLDSVTLVRRAQAGDLQALGDLFARYYERLRCVIQLRMGPRIRSYAEAADIVQETFVVAIDAFDRFEMRDEASFMSWLTEIAEHKIHDLLDYHHARKRDRRIEQAMEYISSSVHSGLLVLEPAISGPSPQTDAELKDEIEFVLECATELPEVYRQAFEVRNFIVAAPDWTRIAEVMGRPNANAARMVHSRATTALLGIMRKRRTVH